MATEREINDALECGKYKVPYVKAGWEKAGLSICANQTGVFYGVDKTAEVLRLNKGIDQHDAVVGWLKENHSNPLFDKCLDEDGNLKYYDIVDLIEA